MMPEDEGSGGSGGSGGEGGEPEPKTFPAEYVTLLRKESAGYRLAAKNAEKERDEAKAAATKAGTDADTKVKESAAAADKRVIMTELRSQARAAGMVDPDFLRLVDVSELKLDDAGNLVGGDKLLEKLKKDKPHYFKEGGSTSSTGEKPGRRATGTTKDARDMNDTELGAEARKYGVRLG